MNSDEVMDVAAEDVVVTNTSDTEQANFMLKKMISDYLAKLNLPTIEEILDKVNEVDQPGILSSMHIKLLQCMVKDYYKATGRSIELVAREQGITLKEGEFSKLEEECLDKLLADYCQGIKNAMEQASVAE